MTLPRCMLTVVALLLFLQQPLALRGDEVVRSDVRREEVRGLYRLPPRLAQNVENAVPTPEVIPPPSPHDSNQGYAGHFPPLPPPPGEDGLEPLPPLDAELFHHGGSYLYAPEGDQWNWPDECDGHYQVLRLPEDWQKPRPVTGHRDFVGVGPIHLHGQWPAGECGCGYDWEPRFVGYGQYEIFGLAFEENNQRQDGIGHQLLIELDLRLTGTERFHMQFRPVGRKNTGGSFYQFSNPSSYIDNSTAVPDRYWFEGEIHSIFGGHLDPFAVADVHFVLGRYPFQLHNNLLMNTDLLGFVVNKNTIYLGNLSNLNVQMFAAREDIAAYVGADGYVYGMNITADHRHGFYEATYYFLQHEFNDNPDMHFLAFSRTQLYGPWVVATRAMCKLGDAAGTGDGQLFVVESNRTKVYDAKPLGIEYGVWYCNAFYATDGWRPISGGGFDRLRASFEVDPLINISVGTPAGDNWGVSLGVQLFRHHEDESIIPEIAVQAPMNELVYGFGLRYLRKTSARSFLEVLGVINVSDDPQFDREGVFAGKTIIF